MLWGVKPTKREVWSSLNIIGRDALARVSRSKKDCLKRREKYAAPNSGIIVDPAIRATQQPSAAWFHDFFKTVFLDIDLLHIIFRLVRPYGK